MICQFLLAVVSHLADLHDAWGIQAALKKSWEVGVLHTEVTPPVWTRCVHSYSLGQCSKHLPELSSSFEHGLKVVQVSDWQDKPGRQRCPKGLSSLKCTA